MSPQPSDLEHSILHTVCWFSVHRYPVSAFEIWKWLWFPVQRYRLDEITTVLSESAWLAGRLQTDGSFFTLRGEETIVDLIALREERFVHGVRKYGMIRRAARYFAALPTVCFVGVGNTLAWWQTREESDIDLFIVARPGTVWMTRVLAVLPFLLLKRRPGAKIRDPFCFSFFAASDHLSLADVRLFGGDPYLAYWTRSLVPIVDREGTFSRFHEANAWCEETLPHAAPRSLHPHLSRSAVSRRGVVWMSRLDQLARRLQERRLPKTLREQANKSSSVIVSDGMLKFHENDRREAFRDRFQELVTTYER